MIGNHIWSLHHISQQDFNMSLFKERAVNARKLISLENTILALKKELASFKQGSSDSSKVEALEAENLALREELASLKKQLAEASAPPATPKRRGRRKTQKAEVSDEQASEG